MDLISYNLYCLFSKTVWETSMLLFVMGTVFGYILHSVFKKWTYIKTTQGTTGSTTASYLTGWISYPQN